MCFLGTILCDICKDLGILVEKDPILQPEFRHLCLSKADGEGVCREPFERFHFTARYIMSGLLRSRNHRIAASYAIAGFGKLGSFMRTWHSK